VVGRTIILKLVGGLLEETVRGNLNRPIWYLACERSSTLCSAFPDYGEEFETMFQSGQRVTGLLWDVTPDRTRVQKDYWFHWSSYSSHIIILQHDPRDNTLYRRVGIAYIN
jgi:hypothetical protein